MSFFRRSSVVALFLAVAMPTGQPAAAQEIPQPPKLTLEAPLCMRQAENSAFAAVIEPPTVMAALGTELRLYFRWEDDENFYYVPAHVESDGFDGRYWAVPPKPDDENEGVLLYLALVAPDRRVVARTKIVRLPVEKKRVADPKPPPPPTPPGGEPVQAAEKDPCGTDLTLRQAGVATSLVIGETTDVQKGEKVDGFLCDGIVTRIDPENVQRPDEFCRACVIAWYQKPNLLLPLVGIPILPLLGGGDRGTDTVSDSAL